MTIVHENSIALRERLILHGLKLRILMRTIPHPANQAAVYADAFIRSYWRSVTVEQAGRSSPRWVRNRRTWNLRSIAPTTRGHGTFGPSFGVSQQSLIFTYRDSSLFIRAIQKGRSTMAQTAADQERKQLNDTRKSLGRVNWGEYSKLTGTPIPKNAGPEKSYKLPQRCLRRGAMQSDLDG